MASLILGGCFGQVPNQMDLVHAFHQRQGNLLLEYQTESGRQVAYYLPPPNKPKSTPQKIAILYPGIGATALGWMKFIDFSEESTTAYLLIDYPGRGFSKGVLHPERTYLNSEGALNALRKYFGNEISKAELNLMGHSFGAAAALQFAVRHDINRIVLVSPFNTLRGAAAELSVFLSIIIPVQIDNRELIQKLVSRDQPPKITILHGAKDKSLPVTMGRELARLAPRKIRYYEFQNDDHVSILYKRRDLIFKSLNGLD